MVQLSTEYRILKTSIELPSLNDLVRLSVHIFNKMKLRNPYIYLQQQEKLWIYFIKLSHFFPSNRPLMVTYFYRGKKPPRAPYIEYSSERREKLRFVDISELTNPAVTYVAIYQSDNFSIFADPFRDDPSKNIIYQDKIDLEGIDFIYINRFIDLVRVASDTDNILLAMKVNGEIYLYVSGFPIPITNISVGNFSVNPIFYTKGPAPMIDEKLATFIKYVEKDVEDERFTFCLGINKIERFVPIIYVKNLPFKSRLE